MFLKSQYPTLFAYHWHTTARLMDCAAKLDKSAYKDDPSYGRGSIHDVLLHLLRADHGWRLGLETGSQQATLPQEGFPDLESLRAGFEGEKAAWQAWLDRLSPEEIAGDIYLVTRRGDTRRFPRWRILHHVLMHGMQHHSELALLLTERGQSPGDLDFIFFS